MAEGSRDCVLTPINGFDRHVPLPKDTTLDRIRVELLNLGAEYVWLDVVCLRQEDETRPEKDIRIEEWMTGVPTIGYIYRSWVNIATYFDGLGRPFQIGDISSPRHWLNRAWTLQETSPGTFIGGMTGKSPFLPNTEGLDATAKQFCAEFTAIAQHLSFKQISEQASAVQQRIATDVCLSSPLLLLPPSPFSHPPFTHSSLNVSIFAPTQIFTESYCSHARYPVSYFTFYPFQTLSSSRSEILNFRLE
ncbi:hypothetical protein NM688_g1218 [Phlebia brevispora]|uniref:Uncharacterized protein n=1 Tax=Phlebia brevispora TaxID=194682 RepID=A0ACC1TCV6_9APHY|nr:hypothetical protein NM688_g1218 [Phlebia brevispora]